ncbi:MAG: cell division protein FtsX [Trueperaceae bacterium]
MNDATAWLGSETDVYALRQALRAIRSNWIASVATMTTMTVCLTILAGFSLIQLNLNKLLEDLQNELEVTAFIDPAADEELLQTTVRSWAEVVSQEFVSREQGFESLLQDIPGLQNSAQLVGNPLPDRIDLTLDDPTQAASVAERLRALPGVQTVQDSSESIQQFLAINDSVRVIGLILIVVLLVSALFAIVNSIRAAITARKNEIDVMRLVGATRGFIRSPFLIEGFLLGFFSAFVTLILVVPGYNYITLRLQEAIGFIPFERDLMVLSRVALLLFTLALLVGLVGSAISVAQHLREER